MSTTLPLRERLARLGPVRDADPPPSFSGAIVAFVLRRDGPIDQPISVVQRLRAAGLTLRSAHAALTELTNTGHTVCQIAEDAGIAGLTDDLAELNVHAATRHPVDPGLIVRVRTRHGLSQRQFADRLGLDIDTLRNWEQGRNKPDPAALALIRIFDQNPDLVLDAVYQPKAP